MMHKILVLNGPNLNMLGKREPGLYGNVTLADIEKSCVSVGNDAGVEVATFQSNSEGELVTRIQNMAENGETGLIINAGAYTHTSIAIHDAIRAVSPKVIEVHISNVHAREDFRHKSYLSAISDGVIVGFGGDGYMYAVQHMSKLLGKAD
ncbi:MAG: type II 3-dehydroquinate dehydratase [Alphaproteobacteria bacterium]